MKRSFDGTSKGTNGSISRRAVVRGISGAGMATALGVSVRGHAVAQEDTADAFAVEPNAGTWKTWILASGDQLRPAAPPNEAATNAELRNVRMIRSTLVAQDDTIARDRIAYWDAGSPGYRWNEIAMQHTLAAGFGPGDAYRTMALLNVAIYDATIAAWDAKYAYNRPRPASAYSSLQTAIPTPNSPSYPSEHAATAGAASAMLSYIFPDSAELFADLAMEASRSRLMAGVEYASDGLAGLDLGQQVGQLVVDYASEDGSDAEFDPASLSIGEGVWTGEPVYPTLGAWKPWVLPDGSAMRPPAPPAWDSAEREAELDEIRSYQRDANPFAELFFWPQDPAGRPEPDSSPFSSNQVVFYYAPVLHFLWGPELAQKISEYRLDTNPPRAARAYALVSVAGFDATVASWEAKFHYMTARPNQFDPTITTVLPTYPIPDYPSAHAATHGGTAQMMAYLFPRDAHFFQSRAEENAASRVWAGIHFRSASDAGVQLGRDVGQAVVDYAINDGADQT